MVVLPVIPGHEIGGVVVEVSDGVPENISVGMACTVNPYTKLWVLLVVPKQKAKCLSI